MLAKVEGFSTQHDKTDPSNDYFNFILQVVSGQKKVNSIVDYEVVVKALKNQIENSKVSSENGTQKNQIDKVKEAIIVGTLRLTSFDQKDLDELIRLINS